MMKRPGFMGLVILSVAFMATPFGHAGEPLSVFVSIAPQKYFVEQIGKGLVDVQVMVPPGANPATYEPKPRQMKGIASAGIYFSVGVPFENVWLAKIAAAHSQMKMVHTDQGIRKIPMAAYHSNDQEGPSPRPAHGEKGGRHQHGGLDPHIWLSPRLVKIQARTILNALRGVDPAHGTTYETNYHQFAASLDRLDGTLKAIFAENRGGQFMVFHPSWGYFADAYGLKQVPIEIEGKDPKPAQLKAVIEHARENGIGILFVQPQFSRKSARLVAREINGRVLVADPLAEDWAANLRRVADQFKAALKSQTVYNQ